MRLFFIFILVAALSACNLNPALPDHVVSNIRSVELSSTVKVSQEVAITFDQDNVDYAGDEDLSYSEAKAAVKEALKKLNKNITSENLDLGRNIYKSLQAKFDDSNSLLKNHSNGTIDAKIFVTVKSYGLTNAFGDIQKLKWKPKQLPLLVVEQKWKPMIIANVALRDRRYGTVLWELDVAVDDLSKTKSLTLEQWAVDERAKTSFSGAVDLLAEDVYHHVAQLF